MLPRFSHQMLSVNSEGSPTSTTVMTVVARGGIVVVLINTFTGSSSFRFVLYYNEIMEYKTC